MSEIMNCPAVRAYRIGKAWNHLRKAQDILEDLELLNDRIDGDFDSIMGYCSELSFEERQKQKSEVGECHGRRRFC